MSNPTIPQSEYQELIKELFGDLPDLNIFDFEEGSEKTTTEPQSQSNSKQKSITTSKVSVGSDTFQPTQMSTPLPEIRNKPIALSPTDMSPIVPNIITNVHNTIAIGAGTCVAYPINPQTLSPLSGASILSGVPNLCYSQTTAPYTIPLHQLNPYQSAVLKDGVVQLPQFQQFLFYVPTIDILKSQNIQVNNCQTEIIPNIPLSPTSNVLDPPTLKRRNFDFLKNIKPTNHVSRLNLLLIYDIFLIGFPCQRILTRAFPD